MNNDVFGNAYAEVYDAIYRDKDYEAECNLIEHILAKHGLPGPRRLLDLGCGTGNHVFPLARRGHMMTGVDRSASMLSHAQKKSGKIDIPTGVPFPFFKQADVRDLDLGCRFDSVIMMFAVLGYQYENIDLMNTLNTVRKHLYPDGLFVFDVWNGTAVLTDRPGQRIRTVKENQTRIIRTTETKIDSLNHRCHVNFEVLHIENNRVINEQNEEHIMRFFFPLELELALKYAGMEIIELKNFSDYEKPADELAWNIVGVARAK